MSSNTSILTVDEAKLISDNITGSNSTIMEIISTILGDLSELSEIVIDSSISARLGEIIDILGDLSTTLDESFMTGMGFIKGQFAKYYENAATLKSNYEAILGEIEALVSAVNEYLPDELV